MSDLPASPDRRRLLLALGFGAANVLALSRLSGSRGPGTPIRTTPRATGGSGPGTPPSVAGAAAEPANDHTYDVVIKGGRVIDPETRFDRVADVGVDGATITAISESPLNGRSTIDATNKVVAPGF